MTCIVGAERPWGCEIAADGLTMGSEYQRCSGPGMEKVARRGKLLLAAAGSGHYCEALLTLVPPTPAPGDGIEWLGSVFTSALRDHFDDRELGFNHTQDTWWEGLAALNGRLYLLDDAGCVSRPATPVVAIGTAGPYAAGAVMAGASLRKAVGIAIKMDVTAGSPVRVMTQRRPASPLR